MAGKGRGGQRFIFKNRKSEFRRNSRGKPQGNQGSSGCGGRAGGRPKPGPPLRPSPGARRQRPRRGPASDREEGPGGRRTRERTGRRGGGSGRQAWSRGRPGRQRPRLGALVPTHPAVHHAETERQPLRRGPRLFSSQAHSARRRRHGSREAAAADSKIQPPSLRAMLIGALCQPPSDRLEPRRAC